jgi:transcriptional regulator with XRE-family HTH domain
MKYNNISILEEQKMIDKIVRDLRTKKGLSSTGLSLEVGMNNTWVSQIETGKIKHPHLPAFKNMLHILGVSEEEIEKIILNEFPEVDKPSKSHSANKTAYKIERKLIRSKRKPSAYGMNEQKNFSNGFLTEEYFNNKCKADANHLFNEIKKLPQLTLDILLTRLVDEL